MPRVLAEYHHGGLYHSLHLLFFKRLGWDLVRPIGYEWALMGKWKYSENPDVVKQYLDPSQCEIREDGYYYYFDPAEEIWHKCVTFEQFMSEPVDLILATISQHEYPWYLLAVEHSSKPNFARLIGNAGEPINWHFSYNLIDTTGLYAPPLGVNYLKMHQEFPLADLYWSPPPAVPKIRSFLNCMPTNEFYEVFKNFRDLLPEFKWFEHGINGADGMITPHKKFADAMRDSTFVWHIKAGGEGYGHVIHNALAMGRVIITVKEMYKGKIAYDLLQDRYTCIDLGAHSPKESMVLIRDCARRSTNTWMSRRTRDLFSREVNFDREAEQFKVWLTKMRKGLGFSK